MEYVIMLFKFIRKWFKTPNKYGIHLNPKADLSSVLIKPIGVNKPNLVLKGEVKHCSCRNCYRQWERKTKSKIILENVVAEYDYCTSCVDLTRIPFTEVYSNKEELIIRNELIVLQDEINYG